MYCNQCEQSYHGTGCVISPGVCGKDADVHSIQELILYGLKGMAAYANHARRLGQTDESVSAFLEEVLRHLVVPHRNCDVEDRPVSSVEHSPRVRTNTRFYEDPDCLQVASVDGVRHNRP